MVSIEERLFSLPLLEARDSYEKGDTSEKLQVEKKRFQKEQWKSDELFSSA